MSEGFAGSAGSQTQPWLVVSLRDGVTCELHADRVVVGSQAYPLSELAWAGLVIDPTAAPVPGAPPPPAVLLRLRNGRDVLLSPAEPPAAWQLLGAIFQARPDLRSPAPDPASGFASAYPPPPPGYGYGQPRTVSSNETVLAGLSHLGVFLGGWLMPLIIWLATRTSAPYASRQAKQAFFWQLIFFALIIIAYFVFIAVFFVGFFSAATFPAGPDGSSSPNPFPFAPFGALLVFYAVFLGGYLINIIFSIIGAVQAFQGKPFHYPLLGWL